MHAVTIKIHPVLNGNIDKELYCNMKQDYILQEIHLIRPFITVRSIQFSAATDGSF